MIVINFIKIRNGNDFFPEDTSEFHKLSDMITKTVNEHLDDDIFVSAFTCQLGEQIIWQVVKTVEKFCPNQEIYRIFFKNMEINATKVVFHLDFLTQIGYSAGHMTHSEFRNLDLDFSYDECGII